MSRLTGADAKGLMEAYNNVYAPQELTEEQVWEEVETWVNSLLEEGYDLSDYTWEEMYESYITEIGVNFGGQKAVDAVNARVAQQKQSDSRLDAARAQRFGSGGGSPSAGKDSSGNVKASGKVGPKIVGPKIVGPKIVGPKIVGPKPPVADGDTSTTPTTSVKPTAPTGGKGKVAPTKPAAATAQTGDKAKDMATFAKANPKLAAAAAERARTRGTSATTNPQMDGLKSRLPAPAAPKVAPSNTLSNTASKPAAFSPAPEVKATNTIAASPKPTPVSPRQQRLNMEMEYDAYDLVLEYLLSEGHADTVEEAHYVMIEMDAETIGSIIEERIDRDPRGRVSSGDMNVYRKPEGKPSQAHLDAVAAHRESEKKKSPEQKKKELDDYIQRQRENK